MKIYQRWRRNDPDTVNGESITLTIVYASLNKDEIDKLQEQMPKGTMVIMETEQKTAGDNKIPLKW